MDTVRQGAKKCRQDDPRDVAFRFAGIQQILDIFVGTAHDALHVDGSLDVQVSYVAQLLR